MRVRDRSAVDWRKFVKNDILKLPLFDSIVTVHSISGLMRFLEQNPTIKSFIIAQPDISAEVIRLLASNKTLTCLDLEDPIDSKGAAAALACNTTLQILKLTGRLGNSGEEEWRSTFDAAWVAAINNMALVELELGLIKIDTATAQTLAENRTLRVLTLGGPTIGTRQITALAGNTALKKLKLDGAFSVDSKTVRALAKNKNLRHLELNNRLLYGAHILELAGNTALETLELHLEGVSSELMFALAYNQTLINLTITSYMPIDESYSWLRAFERNYTLRHVSVAEVNRDGRVVDYIAGLVTLSDQNKHFQDKYAKTCRQLLDAHTLPEPLVLVIFDYLDDSSIGKPVRLFRSSPAELFSLHRSHNAIERQNLQYKTGLLVVLTVGSTIGIFYFNIVGAGSVCIPIVLLVGSIYYGFRFCQNYQEKVALDRPAILGPRA